MAIKKRQGTTSVVPKEQQVDYRALAPEVRLSSKIPRVPQVRGPHGQVFVRGVEIPRVWGPGIP